MNLEATEKHGLQFTLPRPPEKTGYERDADLFKKKKVLWFFSPISRNVFKHLANSHTINSLKTTYAHPIRPASFI